MTMNCLRIENSLVRLYGIILQAEWASESANIGTIFFCFSFPDYIQQKCLILDEDLPYVWSTIINSMSQMPYDAVKYKSKSNNNSLVETSTLHDSTNTTTALSLTNTKENEPEQQYPMTL